MSPRRRRPSRRRSSSPVEPTRGRNSRGRRGLAATVLLPQAQTRARPLRLDWTSWWRSRTTIQQATSVLESAKTLSALRAEGRMGMMHLHGPAPRNAGSALGYAPIVPGPPRGRPQIKRCRLLSPPIASIGRAPYRGNSAQPFGAQDSQNVRNVAYVVNASASDYYRWAEMTV